MQNYLVVIELVYPEPFDDPDKVLRDRAYAWYDIYTKDFEDDKKKLYKDRLEEELSLYEKMGFSSYPLVLQDIIEYAKNNDIMTGPGRGSAAGSLLSFALGLTAIDPIPYGLLFSRYLNRGRAKYPLVEIPGYPLKEWNNKEL